MSTKPQPEQDQDLAADDPREPNTKTGAADDPREPNTGSIQDTETSE